MKKRFSMMLSICLVLCLLLSGCTPLLSFFNQGLVPYSQMEYTRPDMVELSLVLDESCKAALEETDIRKLEDAIWAFYDVYDQFYTNLCLAMIAHSQDLTDIYWEEEYAYCISHSAPTDAGLDKLYRSLAQSPIRDVLEGDDYFGADYFDSFEGESIYDEQLTQMLSQDALLCSQYQSINGQAAAVEYYSEEYFTQYGSQMAEIFLELVELRQQIAAYVGYESYPEFAYDFYHVRDYTPQQATSYLADIRAELVPLYQQVSASGFWDQELPACGEDDTFRYVKSMAQNMGGVISDAFTDMEKAGVYDISYGEKKYATSFEVYLSYYYTPYIFLSPSATEYDKLSFAHEFGHFCTDYVTIGGNVHSVDVAEIFSQGMEYLSLLYAEDPGSLTQLKMADCLGTYVEQAAFASFEHQVYSLTGDELTVEAIEQLYEEICIAYGLNTPQWDSRDYVCVPHFYEMPMYIISYVVSNDAALQIYEMEVKQQGTGLACLENNLYSTQPYILSFLEEAELESPFATGRLMRVRQTLEAILN